MIPSTKERVRDRVLPRAIAAIGAAATLMAARPAHALVNVGPEAGLVKRTADSPGNFDLGFGYGAHAELGFLSLFQAGPYYLHYSLSAADSTAQGGADATFNTLGLRARLVLPLGDIKPYGYIGIGYTWTKYSASGFDAKGHFLETPIGVGLAYQVLKIFQLSLDGAYRPGLSFGGAVYDTDHVPHPTHGWSLLVGAALDL